jgi:hypothetical protein
MSAPNAPTDRSRLPIDGLVPGSRRWEVLEDQASELQARLDYAASPELAAGFPFPHMLELAARL